MAAAEHTLTADHGDRGRRIDLVIRRHLTEVRASRTRIQAWIAGGHVSVNGLPVRRPSSRAAPGDVVRLSLGETPARRKVAAEAVPLGVLYEDEYLLAIDKPAGVVAHPTYKHDAGTLLNALVWRARTWPDPQRPSLVGRLDKLTSGIILVARTAAVHAAMQRAMMSPLSEKDYLAVVYGRVNTSRGRIGLRLGADQQDARKVAASPTTGAESVTLFERMGRVAAPRVGLSLLQCRLVTGRKHQIRAHLAASGWPIVGDPAYGESKASAIVDPALAAIVQAFARQALHAWRVVFVHPITGERVSIEAPLPGDFERLLRGSGLPVPG